MKDKKKLIAVIAGVAIVIAIVVLCICLIPHNTPQDNPSNPTDSTINKIPSDGEGPKIEEVTDENVLKEYEELKEKVKDIYKTEPVKPYIYDNGEYKNLVKDVITFYETFPSAKVEDKEINESPLKEDVFEIKNNLSDFDHLLLENPQPEINSDGTVDYPYKWIGFALDLDEYGYTELKYPQSMYQQTMYYNSKKIVLIEDLFATKEQYYQACYDIMMEFIRMVPEEKLKTCFASVESFVTFTSLRQACNDGDYDILFDGIMNHRVIFVYEDENGIFYRLEYGDFDADMDGDIDNCLNVTIKYTFDDEEKFQ